MKKRILSIFLALCSCVTSFAMMTLGASAEVIPAMSYTQDFEKASSLSDVTELTVTGGNASVVSDINQNTVLKVTGGEELVFVAPSSTTKNKIEVSYKIMVESTQSRGNFTVFGAAQQGTDQVAAAFKYRGGLNAYINVYGQNNNQSIFSLADTAGDEIYHTVKYLIDFNSRTFRAYFDGTQTTTGDKPLRTENTTGVDRLYFDVPDGDVLYFDDITIKDVALKIDSAYPQQGSKNYKMQNAITLNLSAQISSEYVTSAYFKLYENGKAVSSYTVAQPSAGKITITPANGFKGNSKYEVVIEDTVNSAAAGFTAPDADITYSFTTAGFLITPKNDDTYGGKVLVNGKTYTFCASYKNDTGKTQNPVILLATTKNGRMDSIEVMDGYSVASGEVKDFSFDYTASDMDENTKLSILLWNGLDTIIPLAESTVVKGEYADGTPFYEEKLLKELKEKYESKNISGFNIGAITDAQPSVMTGYNSFLHHYGSLGKAAEIIDLDCFADLGDMIDHSFDKAAAITLLENQSAALSGAGLPIFRVKGNHDDNRAVVCAKQDMSYYISNDEWTEACGVDWATVMDGTTAGVKPYYYKDFDGDKIRVIALDSQDVPFVYNTGDACQYKFGYSQEQLDWLANEALDFSDKTDKSEWGVVVLFHAVASGDYNFPEFRTIMTAFMEGTSGTITKDAQTSPITNLTYDFTGQGAMEVICFLDGHTHEDGYSQYLDVPKITITSSLIEKTNTTRELKTETEDAWDIITIDRANRKIYCTRFGAGNDREFSY